MEEGEEKRPTMKREIQEEETEMEMLLNEIYFVTSSTRHDDDEDEARAGDEQCQQMHPAYDMLSSSSSHGLLDGHAGYACQFPLLPPLASERSSLCSLSGILAPADDNGCCRSSAGEDPRLVLPPASAPALADAATNPPLFRSGNGNSFLRASDDVFSVLPNSGPFDVDERLCGSGLQQHCYVNTNSFEPLLEARRRFGAPASHANGLLHTAPENFIPHNGVDLDALNFQSPRLMRERRRPQLDCWMYLRGIPAAVPVPVPKFGRLPLNYNNNNNMGIEGFMYYIAKDKQGCRVLQRKFNEGRHQVDAIFNGIIDHIVELIVDPFGNCLVQKLLDVCSEEQRTRIIFMLTEDAEQFITISLNIYGTRAVQKLIETLKTRRQITPVVLALAPGLLDLIKDLNGYHVIQRCLQTFTAEDNEV